VSVLFRVVLVLLPLLNIGPGQQIRSAISMLIAAALLVLLAMASATWADGQSRALCLDPSAASQQLGPFLQILDDPGAPLGIDQAASPKFEPRFQPNPRRTLHLKPSPYPRWVRFSLKAPAGPDIDRPAGVWHLSLTGPTGPVRCALYIPAPAWPDPPPHLHRQGGWYIQEIGWPGGETGTRGPGGRRTLLLPASQKPVTVYLNLQVAHDQYLPLEVMPGRVLVPDSRRQELLLGLALGMLAGLMAYNLSVFFLLRDTAYLYYILTVTSVGVINFSEIGGFPVHWFSGLPISAMTRMNALLLLVANLAYISFILRFFRLKERRSNMRRPMLWLLWAQAAMSPLYVFLPLATLGPVASGFLAVCMMVMWITTFQGIAHKVGGSQALCRGLRPDHPIHLELLVKLLRIGALPQRLCLCPAHRRGVRGPGIHPCLAFPYGRPAPQGGNSPGKVH
jgi:hypothetical protein